MALEGKVVFGSDRDHRNTFMSYLASDLDSKSNDFNCGNIIIMIIVVTDKHNFKHSSTCKKLIVFSTHGFGGLM